MSKSIHGKKICMLVSMLRMKNVTCSDGFFLIFLRFASVNQILVHYI